MEKLGDMLTRWIEINTDDIKHNLSEVRSALQEETRLMAVVKGDAYGCGSVNCAAAIEAECDMFGVTTLEEAMELRNNNINLPILVFSPLMASEAEMYVQNNITPTIINKEGLVSIGEASASSKHPFQLKIETGMGRLGIQVEDVPALLDIMNEFPNLIFEGIYTHFAKALYEPYVKKQVDNLLTARDICKARGFNNLIIHACASAAFLKYQQYHFDMVRIGTLLYGQAPAGILPNFELKDPWQFNVRILQIKNIKAGESVGYGRDFIASKPLKIAIIPIGLADGFTLDPPTKAKNFIDLLKILVKEILKYLGKPLNLSGTIMYNNKTLPIIGRIGMQMLAVDITNISGIEQVGNLQIGIRRTSTSARIARVYVKKADIVAIRSIMGEVKEIYDCRGEKA